jgi:hypothetical protein
MFLMSYNKHAHHHHRGPIIEEHPAAPPPPHEFDAGKVSAVRDGGKGGEGGAFELVLGWRHVAPRGRLS